MKEAKVTVVNETGLHSRPADLFVRTAKLYESKIEVFKGDRTADAKNIIKVILLNVVEGTEITITADGSDENEAVDALVSLVSSNFADVDERVKI